MFAGDDRNYAAELNKLNANAREIPWWQILHGDGREGWMIPSDLEHHDLATKLFDGLPSDYLADLWLVSDSSLSPKDLLDR